MAQKLTVALAGNPNIGKTTLFNHLTGAHYTVGNWAGVTVEKKEAFFNYEQTTINLVDLPGTYSLSSMSLDEAIARDYIIEESPDLILNLVDASNLERNLYLTLQLLELGKPVVIALNMMDVVEAKGISIDLKRLSKLLNIPIVPIIASKASGLEELLHTLVHTPIQNRSAFFPVTYPDLITKQLRLIMTLLKGSSFKVPLFWLALKLLEGDSNVLKFLTPEQKKLILPYINPENLECITNAKYECIAKLLNEVLTFSKSSKTQWPEKLDTLVTHKYLGFPIFALIMLAVFFFTFNLVGRPLTEVFNICFNYLLQLCNQGLLTLGVSDWLRTLVIEGILKGIFGVLTFLPNIASLFIALTFLEDSGYLARVAFIMDEFMKRLGLNGKAIIPMLLGFGCNVPAIMSTRTIENEKDRLTSILINPFFSCSARLPVFTLFASILFPGKEGLVIGSLYLLGIVIGLSLAFIFKQTLFQSEAMPFLMELPNYHLPTLDHIFNQVWDKVKSFLIKAGTTIFLASTLMWLLLHYNMAGPCEMTLSFGASLGKCLAPLFKPLGFGNWQAALSLISGIVGKEIIVSNLSIIYGLNGSIGQISTTIASHFSSLSAYCFLVFVLLYIPCIGTLGTIKRETNSTKWVIFSIGLQLSLAWLISFFFAFLGQILL